MPITKGEAAVPFGATSFNEGPNGLCSIVNIVFNVPIINPLPLLP